MKRYKNHVYKSIAGGLVQNEFSNHAMSKAEFLILVVFMIIMIFLSFPAHAVYETVDIINIETSTRVKCTVPPGEDHTVRNTIIGSAAGALAGGFIGRSLGGKTGRNAGAVAGAVAGGVIGNNTGKPKEAQGCIQVPVYIVSFQGKDKSGKVFMDSYPTSKTLLLNFCGNTICP